jgi:hypothetical protein
MSRVRAAAVRAPNVLELSLDAKAAVKVGEFARGGVTRTVVHALDHDFGAKATITPYGIFLPAHDDLTLYLTTGAVTADFLVDRLADWWGAQRPRFPGIDTLLLLQDNGPENHSRRTRYMERLVAFGQRHHLHLRLAYYPPYHSKYNPIERCWGVLEQHWNGALLDTVETVDEYARTMTWRGRAPTVRLVTTPYAKGVTLTRIAMLQVEARVRRLPGLPRWFVEIPWVPAKGPKPPM